MSDYLTFGTIKSSGLPPDRVSALSRRGLISEDNNPTIRSQHAAIVYNGYIYISGGRRFDSETLDYPKMYQPNVYRSRDGIKWEYVTNINSPIPCGEDDNKERFFVDSHAMAQHKGSLYIIGGNQECEPFDPGLSGYIGVMELDHTSPCFSWPTKKKVTRPRWSNINWLIPNTEVSFVESTSLTQGIVTPYSSYACSREGICKALKQRQLHQPPRLWSAPFSQVQNDGPPLDPPRSNAAAIHCTLSDDILVLGGYKGQKTLGDYEDAFVKDIYRLDDDSSFSKCGELPKASSGIAAVAFTHYDGKKNECADVIVILGGKTVNPKNTKFTMPLNTVHIATYRQGKLEPWTALQDMPGEVEDCRAVIYECAQGRFIYVIGGAAGKSTFYRGALQYSDSSETWSVTWEDLCAGCGNHENDSVCSIISTVYQHTVSIVDNQIFVVGGHYLLEDRSKKDNKNVFKGTIFCTESCKNEDICWERLPPVNTSTVQTLSQCF